MKRFIRGGASTCLNVITKDGEYFKPKSVFIHVGTMDIQSTGNIDNDEFNSLIDKASKTWPEEKHFVRHILRKKDILDDITHKANNIIESECKKFEFISMIKIVVPTDDMFYDHVHLNNNKGLPAIGKHTKTAMNMQNATYTHISQSSMRKFPRENFSEHHQHYPFNQSHNGFPTPPQSAFQSFSGNFERSPAVHN